MLIFPQHFSLISYIQVAQFVLVKRLVRATMIIMFCDIFTQPMAATHTQALIYLCSCAPFQIKNAEKTLEIFGASARRGSIEIQ
jgi:hypothetical protein